MRYLIVFVRAALAYAALLAGTAAFLLGDLLSVAMVVYDPGVSDGMRFAFVLIGGVFFYLLMRVQVDVVRMSYKPSSLQKRLSSRGLKAVNVERA